MTKSIKKFFILFSVIVIISFTFLSLSSFSVSNTGRAKNEDFYHTETGFDVLILGTSHAVMGIYPMSLWRDFGITSYNLANYGQKLPTDYWILENALKNDSPKLVVLDVYAVYSDEKYSKNHIGYLHEMFDVMPFSFTKARAINDLFRGGDDMWEFFFPFSSVHSRWSTYGKIDFEKTESTYQRGADYNALLATKSDALVIPQEGNAKSTNRKNESETIGVEYLVKMIELLRKNNIEILLVATPFIPTQEQQEWLNGVQSIADTYNVKYIDGTRINVINPTTDYWDKGHLNSAGAEKWTYFLGEYIKKNYDVADYRQDVFSSEWNYAYEKYFNYKKNVIRSCENLKDLIMLLSDHDFSVCIFLTGESEILNDETVISLIQNIDYKNEVNLIEEAVNKEEDYFYMADRRQEIILESLNGDPAENSTFGLLSYGTDKSGDQYLFIHDEKNQLKYEIEDEDRIAEEPDIQIFVLSNSTGELLSTSRWLYSSVGVATKME